MSSLVSASQIIDNKTDIIRVSIPSSLQQDEQKKPDEVRFFYAQTRVQTLVSERAEGA